MIFVDNINFWNDDKLEVSQKLTGNLLKSFFDFARCDKLDGVELTWIIKKILPVQNCHH